MLTCFRVVHCLDLKFEALYNSLGDTASKLAYTTTSLPRCKQSSKTANTPKGKILYASEGDLSTIVLSETVTG